MKLSDDTSPVDKIDGANAESNFLKSIQGEIRAAEAKKAKAYFKQKELEIVKAQRLVDGLTTQRDKELTLFLETGALPPEADKIKPDNSNNNS